jgi:phospholipid/cholesterol/gamma-HCH transport system permease protein
VYCAAERHDDRIELSLHGHWQATALTAIQSELAALSLRGATELKVEAHEAIFDLSGAWLLHDFLHTATAGGHVQVEFAGGPPSVLQLIDRTVKADRSAPEVHETSHTVWLDPAEAVEDIGRLTVRVWRDLESSADFVGHVTVAASRAAPHIRRWRPIAIARHVYDTGISAMPIVALIGFLIAVILAYMGAQQLRKFGADIFVVDLVTVGVLRELGVLLTAIIVAGRSGSAFAAEIGAMCLNEEVDALRAIGVDPVEVLVVPRVIGLVIALPLLTIIADLIGLAGGALLCHFLLGMPLSQFLNRANDAIASTTFWVGMLKAPVFALLIALAGCWCGLRVRGSSRSLGRYTTLAVVEAIFLVILADALFAVLFMKMDI